VSDADADADARLRWMWLKRSLAGEEMTVSSSRLRSESFQWAMLKILNVLLDWVPTLAFRAVQLYGVSADAGLRGAAGVSVHPPRRVSGGRHDTSTFQHRRR